jgi:nucleotide-binding universal stress UspA family protein
MTIKTIGLTLLSAAETEWVTTAACALARAFDAHLIGVHAAELIIPFSGVTAFDPVMAPEFLDWQVDEARTIGATFQTVTSREAMSAEFRGQEAGTLGAEAFLLEGLRAADLVVSAQLERGGWNQTALRLQEQVIRSSGRPVLVLPRERPLAGLASHLLLGISPTRESARAAHDALMLAAPGATIDLLSVSREAQPGRVSFDFRQDLAAALDRLGYSVSLVDREGPAGEAGEVLLEAAAERGADLVATGAFGHSRTYDFVIGAVTGHLLGNATLPVLFSK